MVQRGGISDSWGSSTIIGLLVGFVVIFAVFIAFEAWLGDRSSISIRLLRSRNLGILALGPQFACGVTFYSIIYYIPICTFTCPFYYEKEEWSSPGLPVSSDFQTVQGSSPLRSGVQMLPIILLNMSSGIAAGWVCSKWVYSDFSFGPQCDWPVFWTIVSDGALGIILWLTDSRLLRSELDFSRLWLIWFLPENGWVLFAFSVEHDSILKSHRYSQVGFQMIGGSGMGALYMLSFIASQVCTSQLPSSRHGVNRNSSKLRSLAVAKPEDRPKASALVCFFQIWSATVSVSASEAIYQNSFKNGVEKIAGVDAVAIVESGVSEFRNVVDERFLPAVMWVLSACSLRPSIELTILWTRIF
jgi:hypothetical protein